MSLLSSFFFFFLYCNCTHIIILTWHISSWRIFNYFLQYLWKYLGKREVIHPKSRKVSSRQKGNSVVHHYFPSNIIMLEYASPLLSCFGFETYRDVWYFSEWQRKLYAHVTIYNRLIKAKVILGLKAKQYSSTSCSWIHRQSGHKVHRIRPMWINLEIWS